MAFLIVIFVSKVNIIIRSHKNKRTYRSKHDEDNNARWKVGNGYMGQCNEITAGFDETMLSSPELIAKINALRSEFFKHEAETIGKEEAQGFYRFNRPRVYGRN